MDGHLTEIEAITSLGPITKHYALEILNDCLKTKIIQRYG